MKPLIPRPIRIFTGPSSSETSGKRSLILLGYPTELLNAKSGSKDLNTVWCDSRTKVNPNETSMLRSPHTVWQLGTPQHSLPFSLQGYTKLRLLPAMDFRSYKQTNKQTTSKSTKPTATASSTQTFNIFTCYPHGFSPLSLFQCLHLQALPKSLAWVLAQGGRIEHHGPNQHF